MFFGEKLRNLRELNGLSRKELADQLTVSEQAVWQYEAESMVPGIGVLNHLRQLFQVDTRYFFTKDRLTAVATEEHVAYRARDRESRKKTKLELAYINYLDNYLNYFERFLVSPTASIRALQRRIIALVQAHTELTDTVIAQAAEEARQYLGLTSNRDLMYVLEMSGIYIVEKDLGPVVDAYSTVTKDGRAFIVLGNIKKSAVRRNFDLAHELGHLLLHTTVDMATLTKAEHKLIEQQANMFASVFLMPVATFKADFTNLRRRSNPDSYIELKQKYLVSIVALEYRAYKLGLLTYQENRYFFGQVHKKGYAALEPLDDQLAPVRPSRIKSLIQLLFSKQVLTVSDLGQTLHVTPAFIIRLFSLDANFFEPYMQHKQATFSSAEIIPLKRFV